MNHHFEELSKQDPVTVVLYCRTALLNLLRNHWDRSIQRLWIDHPYGEKALALLEEELLPAIESRAEASAA